MRNFINASQLRRQVGITTDERKGASMTTANKEERINMRTAEGETDFWLLRGFLEDTWPLAAPFFNWEVRRLDGAYFHNEKPGWDARWNGGRDLALWQKPDGQLVGAVHPEGKGDAWLEVHPQYRWLEEAMLDWAEANLARPNKEGHPQLAVFTWEYDKERQEQLHQRGYTRTDAGDVLREKPYNVQDVPAPTMPEGYRLHEVRPGHPEDCERYAALLNAAFKRSIHTAKELATFTTMSPSYCQEIELVAVAPDGSFAALTGMTYDEDHRFGSFEPVCAVPGPKPLGLTGKLMLEGYRRVRQMGAEHCYVGTGIGMAANRFYDAVGFKIIHMGWYWKKKL
jgi:mycothiol synthase